MLEGLSLAEKQMHYYNAHKCIYCNGYTNLIDSGTVYQESHGLIYRCDNCDAHVGVKPGNDQALGTVAKKGLRDLRREAHKWFDPMWQKKARIKNLTPRTAKSKAYKWLASILNISREEAHIGYLLDDQCKILIEECKKYWESINQNPHG